MANILYKSRKLPRQPNLQNISLACLVGLKSLRSKSSCTVSSAEATRSKGKEQAHLMCGMMEIDILSRLDKRSMLQFPSAVHS
ncbi:hypothetical protein BDW75DRAFT_216146 [Aspergillus navahoensis]